MDEITKHFLQYINPENTHYQRILWTPGRMGVNAVYITCPTCGNNLNLVERGDQKLQTIRCGNCKKSYKIHIEIIEQDQKQGEMPCT